jgi:hypothetical protein
MSKHTRNAQERMISIVVGPKGAEGRFRGGQSFPLSISQLKVVFGALLILSPSD